jgi:hypothetical protein
LKDDDDDDYDYDYDEHTQYNDAEIYVAKMAVI